MLFTYEAVDQHGQTQEGTIDVVNKDAAISALQKRGLTIYSIESAKEGSVFDQEFTFLSRVSSEDLVVLSRQIATLFQARVSTLEMFRVLAEENPNPKLRDILNSVADDVQGGSSIADAFSRHPNVFSTLFVNMVRAGEESGKLSEMFEKLADHMERTHDLITKTRNALVYPTFVIVAFVGVMVLMFTFVIPRIQGILTDSGQELPIYTKIVLGISTFFANWWLWLLIVLLVGVAGLIWYVRTEEGAIKWDRFMLSIPYVGDLLTQLYLSRFADGMNTMIDAGIPMVRALEISEDLVGSPVYKEVFSDVREDVRGGSSFAVALGRHPEITGIFTQMVRVGEESGQVGPILDTIGQFYRRAVLSSIDTVIGLIEPAMIIILGVGVAVLLASILMPIYNMVGAI